MLSLPHAHICCRCLKQVSLEGPRDPPLGGNFIDGAPSDVKTWGSWLDTSKSMNAATEQKNKDQWLVGYQRVASQQKSMIIWMGKYISRMRSKGSRFTLGVWGWSCVRQTLRLFSQPFGTVRNCSQPSAWGPHGRAYGKFCKRGHFWSFPASRSCHFAWQAWYFVTFQHVSGRAKNHFAWQAQQCHRRKHATRHV